MSNDYCYRPSGELQGDDKPMPNKGTATGWTGHRRTTEGMDTGPEAENRIVGIKGSTGSDAMEKDMPPGPR